MLLKIKDVHGERVGFRVQGSGERLLGTLPRSTKLRNRLAPLDSMSDGKGQTKNMEISKNTNNTGMSMKTKGRLSIAQGKAGMSMKNNGLSSYIRECC